MRYFIFANDQPLALISFSASAWQCAPRDQHIGWTHDQRKLNLHLIINNSRFLILPWVQSKNLASKILAMAARRIARDWQRMGQTKGRGKLGPSGKISVPIKDIWLYPINAEYKNKLTDTQ